MPEDGRHVAAEVSEGPRHAAPVETSWRRRLTTTAAVVILGGSALYSFNQLNPFDNDHELSPSAGAPPLMPLPPLPPRSPMRPAKELGVAIVGEADTPSYNGLTPEQTGQAKAMNEVTTAFRGLTTLTHGAIKMPRITYAGTYQLQSGNLFAERCSSQKAFVTYSEWLMSAARQAMAAKRQPVYDTTVLLSDSQPCPGHDGEFSARQSSIIGYRLGALMHFALHQIGGLSNAIAEVCNPQGNRTHPRLPIFGTAEEKNQCRPVEYGDIFSLMGNSGYHLNGLELLKLGGISPDQVQTIDFAGQTDPNTQAVSVTALDDKSDTRIKLLRVPMSQQPANGNAAYFELSSGQTHAENACSRPPGILREHCVRVGDGGLSVKIYTDHSLPPKAGQYFASTQLPISSRQSGNRVVDSYAVGPDQIGKTIFASDGFRVSIAAFDRSAQIVQLVVRRVAA